MKLQIFLNFIRAHRCPRLDWFSFKTESPIPLKSPQTWSSWANWPFSSPVFPLIPFSSGLEFNLEHHMGPVSLVSSKGQQCLRISLSFMTGTLLRRAVRYGQSESPSVCVCPNFSMASLKVPQFVFAQTSLMIRLDLQFCGGKCTEVKQVRDLIWFTHCYIASA